MGIRVRLAPGISVGVSKRGVRTSIGPRIARLHVGAGSVGISSGLGPVTVGTSLGTSKNYRHTNYRDSFGLLLPTSSQSDEAEFIQRRTRELTEAHKVALAPRTKPLAQLRTLPSESELEQRYLAKNLQGLSPFKLMERADAKDKARKQAASERNQLLAAAEKDRVDAQNYFDRLWDGLETNEPAAVVEVLTQTFGTSEAVAAVVDVTDDTVTLTVLAPEYDQILSRVTDFDAAGQFYVRDATSSEMRRFYLDMVSSQAVAVLRSAFWAAPKINRINLVVIRQEGYPGSSSAELSCLGFGAAIRNRGRSALLAGSPFQVLSAFADPWTSNVRSDFEMLPCDLSDEPELKLLISQLQLQ